MGNTQGNLRELLPARARLTAATCSLPRRLMRREISR